MRDTVDGAGAGASSATDPSNSLSGFGDRRRLFLDVWFSMAAYDGEVLVEDACEVSLSELEDKCEEFRRISCGMAVGSEVKALQIELGVECLRMSRVERVRLVSIVVPL